MANDRFSPGPGARRLLLTTRAAWRGSGQGEAAAAYLCHHRPGRERAHPLPSQGGPAHWQGGVHACQWGSPFPSRGCHGGLGRGHGAGTQQGFSAQLSAPSEQWLEETGCPWGWTGTHLSLERQTDVRGTFWALSVNGTNSRASQVGAGSHRCFVNFGHFRMKWETPLMPSVSLGT